MIHLESTYKVHHLDASLLLFFVFVNVDSVKCPGVQRQMIPRSGFSLRRASGSGKIAGRIRTKFGGPKIEV